MTRTQEYRYLAECMRRRAKVADSKGQAMEWNWLADCICSPNRANEVSRSPNRDPKINEERERSIRKKNWVALNALPVDRFKAEEGLAEVEIRCRCTVCRWRRADLRPDFSARADPRTSVGWMMPPT